MKAPRPVLQTLLALCVLNVANAQIADQRFISSVNGFGFTVLNYSSQSDLKKNVFISPASILFALSMVDNGARGETSESIHSALGLRDFTTDDMNRVNKQTMESLMLPDSMVKLAIANSVWVDHSISLNSQFVSVSEDVYRAAAVARDFAPKSTVDEINKWVSDNTRGKIPSIISKLEPENKLILLDAVYFAGTWTRAFDRAATKEKPFFQSDGTEKSIPLMVQGGMYQYSESDRFQSVNIPYGDRFSMSIFLPKSRSGLPTLLEELVATGPTPFPVRTREGHIEIPRFTLDYSTSLVQVLTALGMGVAFREEANFSGITDSPLFISDVLHKTYLQVNEQGTTAAAVTSIQMGFTKSAKNSPPPPFVMIVDHPFVCVIKDNTTGLILFCGAIVDPTAAE